MSDMVWSKKTMEILPIIQRVAIDPELDIEVELTRELRYFIAEFKADVVAEKLVEDTYSDNQPAFFHTPATTWQMFKETHKTSWWLKRFVAKHPVRTVEHVKWVRTEVVVHRYLKYPQAEIPKSRLGRPVAYELLERK